MEGVQRSKQTGTAETKSALGVKRQGRGRGTGEVVKGSGGDEQEKGAALVVKKTPKPDLTDPTKARRNSAHVRAQKRPAKKTESGGVPEKKDPHKWSEEPQGEKETAGKHERG